MLNLSHFNAVKPEFRADDTIALNIDNTTNNVEMVITPIVVSNQGHDIIKIQNTVSHSTIEGINQNDVFIYDGINVDTISIKGGNGVDTISIKGGDGIDTIVIGADDIIKIQGLVPNSTIDGGSGNVVSIFVKGGEDTIVIGGNDTIVISGDDIIKTQDLVPNSTIYGGSGNDNLVISGADLEKYIILPVGNDCISGQQKLDVVNINSLANMINNLVANDGNKYENEYTGGLIGSFSNELLNNNQEIIILVANFDNLIIS